MREALLKHFNFLREPRVFSDSGQAVAYIGELYKKSIGKIEATFEMLTSISDQAIRSSLSNSLAASNPLADTPAKDGLYPFIGLYVGRENLYIDPSISYGVIHEPGCYGTTLTRPDLFDTYIRSQLELLTQRHNILLIVGLSQTLIPLPYVIEQSREQVDDDQLWIFKNGFVLPNLSHISDDIANGTIPPQKIQPLSLFSAERVDYSLHRLSHYTGTSSHHFQSFILLTNYQRYVDAFIDYSKQIIENDSENDQQFIELIGPGGMSFTKERGSKCDPLIHLPQMPAYHLKRSDNQGITFINIGVGPSNAKNITDHLAVLRPHCWLMIGHCAGLRSTQMLGDYVLAHGYVREDHVLDHDLPPWIPVPPIAEVQVALQEAIQTLNVKSQHYDPLKLRVRTGTVVTTDDRNWELRSREMYERFRQSRAIAVDMESATIAANGFRFRVPYGTLLCVSDKPIHGEIKLQGMANFFYKQRVKEHLFVGIEAIEILRKRGVDQLHSRKLRGFDEPPFR